MIIQVKTKVWRVRSNHRVLYWSDEMNWWGVDQETVDWFTGSCKAALSWFVNYPEPTSTDDCYEVTYSTVIEDAEGNKMAGTVPNAELGPLDYKGVCEFQRFALGQLQELIQFFEDRKGKVSVQTKKRSKWATLGKLAWGAIRA